MVATGYLKRDIIKCLKSDYDDSCAKSKIKEIEDFKYMHDDAFYKDLVYTASYDAIDPVIVFSETKKDNDIWEYFRVFTSSISTKRGVGRLVRFFVKDKITNKYLGIAAIGEDPYAIKARDEFIGWEHVDDTKLKHIVNIVSCVPLQPFGFNYNGGKLMVAACYSKEVISYFEAKYDTKIAMINTFSINGKSIMYDRLPFIKYVGLTTGSVPSFIPDNILTKGMALLAENNIAAPTRPGRLFKLRAILKFLGLDLRNLIQNGKPRGVYVGYTGTDAAKFLKSETTTFESKLASFDANFKWWKTRWAAQRIAHLKREEKVKNGSEFSFVNPKKEKERLATQASTEAKIAKMGPEEYRKKKAEYMKEYRQKQLISIEDKVLAVSEIATESEFDLDYMAGFFDGDGSIVYSNNTVKVDVSQCDPNILKLVCHKYGASLRVVDNGENARPLFKCELAGRFVRAFMNDIKGRLVLKSTHANGILDILDAQDHIDTAKLAELRKLLETPWNKTKMFYERINWSYIAGLFDAEGCILMNSKNQLTISITQASDRQVLDEICKYCNMFRVEKSGVRVVEYTMANINTFLKRVLPLLHVKKAQSILAIEATEKPRPGTDRLDEINMLIAADKHKLFKFPEMMTADELNELRKEQNAEQKTVEKAVRKEINRELVRERMTGEGNPNFGVERTDEHSTAISIGQRKAKLASRKITDAEIDAIQAARAQGTKIQEIADKFGYSRGYISDICRGKVLKSTEQLDQVKIDARIADRKIKRAEGPLSEEEINKRNSIARRKITPSQVIGIIKARRANAELSFRMLGEMFGGMAINQARNAFVGETKLFESEFPIDGVTWEEYQGWF